VNHKLLKKLLMKLTLLLLLVESINLMFMRAHVA